MSKSMNDILACKVQELNSLKISHWQLSIANTASEAKNTMLTIKSTGQNGTDSYAQLQKDFKELQVRLRKNEDESELYEKQCINLTEAFLQQGMNLPSEIPGSAPAPALAEDHG
jgi:hypothetical protein